MIDLLLVGVIGLIVGSAITYIIKEKKKGVQCIGCPMAGKCTSCKSKK